MEEQRHDLKICKDCRRLRKRILMGKFDTINKKYHDDDGHTWNGHRCGVCHKEKMKRDQRERAAAKQNILPQHS